MLPIFQHAPDMELKQSQNILYTYGFCVVYKAFCHCMRLAKVKFSQISANVILKFKGTERCAVAIDNEINSLPYHQSTLKSKRAN